MSIQIDFYILADQTGREQLACRLAETAYQRNHRVYLHCDSDTHARQLDDLLWSFRQGSFVPHSTDLNDSVSPVLIGYDSSPPESTDVLINLASEIPDFFDRFNRVLEIVDQHPDTLRQSRQRFKFYKQQGFQPNTHKL